MNLRIWLVAWLGGLATLLLGVAVALVVLTNAQDRSVGVVESAVDSVHIAEEMKSALLSHRLLGGSGERPRAAHALAQGQTQDDLEMLLLWQLGEVEALANSDGDRVLGQELEQNLASYLDAQRDARGHSVDEVAARTAPAFAATLASLDRLVSLQVEQAREARAFSANVNRFGNVTGLVASGLLFLGLLSTLFLLKGRSLLPPATA